MNLEERYKSSKQGTIKPYNFTSRLTSDISRLNIDGIPSRYSKIGKLYTSKDTSNLNIDSITTKYHP